MKRTRIILIGLILIFLLGFFLITFQNFKNENSKKYSVKLTDTIDPDIVLVNFEQGDRSFIGNLLLKVNRCNPRVIGIDAFFIEEKDSIQDSALIKAFDVVQNDVIAYFFNSNGIVVKSVSKFLPFVKDVGFVGVEEREGLSSFFTPILTINNETHKHFALQILKHYKPNYKPKFKTDELIPIQFTRTLDQFMHFDGSKLTDNNCADLKNKIVLIGYLGPTEEDKHFTPLRYLGRFDADEPDTYGLVINANVIRTILGYENK